VKMCTTDGNAFFAASRKELTSGRETLVTTGGGVTGGDTTGGGVTGGGVTGGGVTGGDMTGGGVAGGGVAGSDTTGGGATGNRGAGAGAGGGGGAAISGGANHWLSHSGHIVRATKWSARAMVTVCVKISQSLRMDGVVDVESYRLSSRNEPQGNHLNILPRAIAL
jgi:hypothetical protein